MEAATREDAVPGEVNVSFTINMSVVSTLLAMTVLELVSTGVLATATTTVVVVVVVVVAVVVVVNDGVSNISVVIIGVVSLGKLVVVTSGIAVDVGSVLVMATMVTMVTGCADDNSDDALSMKRP